MSERNIRLGLSTGLAALSLLTGGLLFGGARVSAQEPTPEPTEEEVPEEDTPVTPSTPQEDSQSEEDGNNEREKGECHRDEGGSTDSADGEGTSLRFRGGLRSLAQ